MVHWVARKENKVISAVSTLIEDDRVSLWNGATLPAYRRHGLSAALCRSALTDTISRGCRIGMAYIMVEGLALGICKGLGYQTKWRFHAFAIGSTTKSIVSKHIES